MAERAVVRSDHYEPRLTPGARLGPGPVRRGVNGPPPLNGRPRAPLRKESRPPPIIIDREKTCPMLVRLFTALDKHHSSTEFTPTQVPAGELQIYTWMDCTLRDLTDLVKQANEDARKNHARLSFAFTYPDSRGEMIMREVGVVHSLNRGEDDLKTLHELRFVIGDFVDVAVLLFPPVRRIDDRLAGDTRTRRLLHDRPPPMSMHADRHIVRDRPGVERDREREFGMDRGRERRETRGNERNERGWGRGEGPRDRDPRDRDPRDRR